MTSEGPVIDAEPRPIDTKGSSTPTDPSWDRRTTVAITVLLLVMVVNYMDRAVLAVLLEPIGRDLNLSDSALGLLAGLPFAILYALAGVPFARVADIGNRKILIALSVALWSIATAVCGLATGLLSLFLMRIMVGIGEGAGTPAIHSVMTDQVRLSKRSFAAGLLVFAGILGGALGYVLGGTLAGRFGWRTAFASVGAPGLLVALLILNFVPESRPAPRWPRWDEIAGVKARSVALRLIRLRSFRLLVAAFTLSYGVQNGITQWLAVYLAREFGRSIGEIGATLGVVLLLPTAAGSMLGGILGGVLSRRLGTGWLLLIAAWCCLAMFLAYLAFVMAGQWVAALTALGVSSLLAGIYLGPVFAAIYALGRSSDRATVVALVALFTNVIGLGLAPLLVGTMSDQLAVWLGVESLKYAMGTLTTLLLPASALFFLAARRLVDDSSNE